MIIDPDWLELGNLGESVLASEADIGRPKAEVIAEKLNARSLSMICDCRVASISSPEPRRAAAEADVIITCVDRDSARLDAAMTATQYHRLLIDIGVGVFHIPNPTSENFGHRVVRAVKMGADVRLIATYCAWNLPTVLW
jgi:molybdopterin/thiamine biosynthesis adenylyltransferase